MRFEDKVKEIEKYLLELNSIVPETFEEYSLSFEKKASCERYFEKIIESLIDLTFSFFKEKGFKIPSTDTETFEILENRKIIPKQLSSKLMEAKSMRNIIVHCYGDVDDEVVFNSVKEELQEDIDTFIKLLKENL